MIPMVACRPLSIQLQLGPRRVHGGLEDGPWMEALEGAGLGLDWD